MSVEPPTVEEAIAAANSYVERSIAKHLPDLSKLAEQWLEQEAREIEEIKKLKRLYEDRKARVQALQRRYE